MIVEVIKLNWARNTIAITTIQTISTIEITITTCKTK